MQYGNCFIGAIALMWVERKNSPRFFIGKRPGTYVPHFMVQSKTGLHHFRVVNDILPWPLCYLIFRGRFQTLSPEMEAEFSKQRGRSLWNFINGKRCLTNTDDTIDMNPE